QTFSENLEAGLRREARGLLAADLVLSSSRAFDTEEEAALKDLMAQGAEVTRTYEFVSMARDPGRGTVQTVSVRAVGSGYPFYGEVLTGSGQPLRAVLRDGAVLVERTLLLQLGLEVGHPLGLGERTFIIADTLEKEPDSPVQLFRLGARVLLTEADALTTGLMGPVSRLRNQALVRLPATLEPFATAQALRARLPDRFSRITTYDQAQPRVSRFMGRLTDYLSLVGLVALLLGGIGVAGAVRVFMAQKMDTLATLKCLGASSGTLLSVYLLQVVMMGLLGSILGVSIGIVAATALPTLLGDLVPVSLGLTLPWGVVAQGLALGPLTAVWFALPPLLGVRKVPPAQVFRRTLAGETTSAVQRWREAAGIGLWALTLAALLVLWQVGPGRVAWMFLAGLAGTVTALYGAVMGLLWLLHRLPKPPRFEWRQGVSSLYRPGNQSAAVVVSLGLGVLLLMAVFLVRSDLLSQVAPLTQADPPNLFFIDIQRGQEATFRKAVQAQGLASPVLVPVVRGRITVVNGQPVKLDETKDDHTRQHLTYEYGFTYRDQLEPGEQVTQGRFERDPAIPGAQVSVADWWAKDSGVGVGDTFQVDIQGVRIDVTVTSIRAVDWSNRRTNFSFVFLPGAIEEAPGMFVAALSVPEETARVAVQREVVSKLPNVTALDVQSAFAIVQSIMDRIALVIEFMAGFCIAVGLVILLGAIATTRYQRMREAVLLKTLGATRGMVARVLTLEYLLLGSLAGLVGALAAAVFSWGLVNKIFEGHWQPSPGAYLAAWGLTALVVAVAGLASSGDVLMRKPLEVLREE
ncbi:MAG: FtsX-like permease family protein, partial [Deltaproteobacteria bacterium]|nr:FtsX-like permease family protein [Deltaproteobacteria bacterium]